MQAEGLPWLSCWGQSTTSHLFPPCLPLMPARLLPLQESLPGHPPPTPPIGIGGLSCLGSPGLARALLTLLCMGLLYLRFHLSLAQKSMRKTPRLSPPSPQPQSCRMSSSQSRGPTPFKALAWSCCSKHGSPGPGNTHLFSLTAWVNASRRLVVTSCSEEHSHPALSC